MTNPKDVPPEFYDLDYYKVMLKSLMDEAGNINTDLDERLQAIMDFIQPKGNDIVLDIGCGTGHLLLNMVNKVEAVVGVDYSDTAIKIALYLFKDIDPEKYRLYCSDLMDIDFNCDPTLVLMVDVVEHIPQQKLVALMNELKPHLRTGCRVIVETPIVTEDVILDPDFEGGPNDTQQRYSDDPLLKDYEYLHIRRYTIETLVEIMNPLNLTRTLHPERNLFEFTV